MLVGQENTINRFTHLWAVDSKGYCFSINLIVKVVPDRVGYMMLGNLFKLNEDHYALTDQFGMMHCIGKETGKALYITPDLLCRNLCCILIFIPKLIFRFMNLFEFDGKVIEKIDKYFNETGRSEFKVTILIPNDIEEIVTSFTSEIRPFYTQLNTKEKLREDLQDKLGDDYIEKHFEKEILSVKINFTAIIIKYIEKVMDIMLLQKYNV